MFAIGVQREKKNGAEEKERGSTQCQESTRPGPVFIPAVDIFETTNEIVVLADMPGVESKSIDIDLRDNLLTLRGHIDPVVGEKELLSIVSFLGGITSGLLPSRR